MNAEGPGDPAGGSITRGFLFSDLRGYTQFVEASGAAAAAELLGRYRAIVRNAVARHQGAEIKTEGDSFYVVFPAVSSAVRCGLDILAAVHLDGVRGVGPPIRVGIGVHAGETVETSEGYVGTAVNVAARVCAQAAAGELLVTDTVRTLTASVLPVRYMPRGRRQLKGVAEPVALYRVEVGTALPVRAGAPRGAIAALIGALVIVAAVAGAILLGLPGRAERTPGSSQAAIGPGGADPTTSLAPGPTLAPTPAASAQSIASPTEALTPSVPEPLSAGDLGAGSYLTQRFQPPVVMTVPDGWSADPESPDYLVLRSSDQPDDQLSFHRVLRASSDGCFTLSLPVNGPVGLYDWLESRPEVAVGTLVHRSVHVVSTPSSDAASGSSTVPAWQVDIQVIGGSSCGANLGTGLYLFPLSETEITEIDPAKQWLFIRQGQRARIVVANLASGDVTLVARTLSDTDFAAFASRATDLTDQLAFVMP